ncbi:hypothetical protein F4861DRAFT_548043 [Xylaria intraflava]|nr:hypothetical protein F4861DRAFT_548043 [Xylaria intraflava]
MASTDSPTRAMAGLSAGIAYKDTLNSGVPALPPAPQTTAKLRSCVVCRARKVRCDKKSPCSNCRRAGIPCVLPSSNRTPRWAKNYGIGAGERSTQAVESPTTQVMERLRYLENLVKELRGQPNQAPAAGNSSMGGSPTGSSQDRGDSQEGAESLSLGKSNIQSQFGRLVLNDPGRSRYVTSEFWSRVNDELDQIKVETEGLEDGGFDSSDEDEMLGTSQATNELDRTPFERHSFLFGHNLNSPGPDLAALYPLPSQIPFLLDIFAENVNFVFKIVHMPTIRRMTRPERSGEAVRMTPANEALMFSIYYAAITSMEGDDVVRNFGATKADLNLKYRLGLEHALAKSNFLNVLDIVVVQALAIFLFLVRRHDSPRFVWMMLGLAIRMAQGLGLQRDGAHFKHLTPFEVETRRRVWYALCALDVRSSQDQGTDFTIQYGSFDTELPKNINDDDIDVHTKESPEERKGLTDTTICIVSLGINNISRQMMLPGVSIDDQRRLLQDSYQSLEERYLRFATESGDMIYRELVLVARLLGAKLMLLSHLPILFSSPSENFSDNLRNELLVAALGVVELNHSLYAERAYRRWRWIFQTYTHWHSILYLLLDICRRPWSPIVERAWIALHSPWLIPGKAKVHKATQTWAPVRRLILKARKHRETELERLRGNMAAASQLEANDRKIPAPPIVGALYADSAAAVSRDKWRRLVGLSGQQTPMLLDSRTSPLTPDPASYYIPVGTGSYLASHNAMGAGVYHQPSYAAVAGNMPSFMTGQEFLVDNSMPSTAHDNMLLDQISNIGFSPSAVGETGFTPRMVGDGGFAQSSVGWSDSYAALNSAQTNWYLADENQNEGVFADLDMDLLNSNFGTNADFEMNSSPEMEGEMDWHSWVQAARTMEMENEQNSP